MPKIESKEALIRAHTGEVIPEDAHQRQKRAERAYQERIELAIRVAESERRPVGTVMKLNELHWVGLCSGLSQKAHAVPRRMVIPEFASKNRNETMTALAYYMTEHPGCRHLVLTAGRRIPSQEVALVPGALRWIMDRIRRLKDRDWFAGRAEVVMRSAEIKCDGDSFHPHVHVVIRPLVRMTEGEWIEVIAEIRATFGTGVADLGPVTEPHGIARYLFKGTTHEDIDPLALGALFALLKNLRTHEPLGSFRDMCRELRRTNTRFITVGNRLVRMDRRDGTRKSSLRPSDDEPRSAAAENGVAQPKEPPKNLLLHISHPVARATRVKEPYLLICNYAGDFDAFLTANPKFAKLREELLPKWRAGVAAAGNPPIVPSVQTTDRHDPADAESTDEPGQDSLDGLIAKEDLVMLGFDPSDYFWHSPTGESHCPPAWIADETSFPI